MLTSSTAKAAADPQLRRGTVLFFVTAFAITWLSGLPAVLAQRGLIPGPADRFMPLVGLGVFGPLLAAVLVSCLESGSRGVRVLFGQLGNLRAKPIWYFVALALPGTILGAGMAVCSLFGGTGRWFYPPVTSATVAALFIIPFTEEIGWRGFAFPRLEKRWGALHASLVLGVLWALWHTAMFLLAGLTPSMFVIMVPYFVAGSVIFTWLYLRPGGGLPLVILAHAGAHLSNSHQTLPGDMTPLIVQTIGFCAVAFSLILWDRRVWRL